MKALLAVLIALAGPAGAVSIFDLPLGAVETARVEEPLATHLLPTARFTPAAQPGLTLEGRVLIRAWRLPLDRADTLAVMRALRDQVEARGFRILHACNARACGGFDFRFKTRVLPAPAMAVDLADFRYLSAAAREGPGHHLGILVSRSTAGGHVQIAEITPNTGDALPLTPPEQPRPQPPADVSALVETGRAVLAGVTFGSGTTGLTEDAVDALAPLATVMTEDPGLVVVIVGHSDNSGSLAANLRVSRARAGSVRRALIEVYGIAAARITAEGAGYLAPLAPNATEEGRAANRRVEVILR